MFAATASQFVFARKSRRAAMAQPIDLAAGKARQRCELLDRNQLELERQRFVSCRHLPTAFCFRLCEKARSALKKPAIMNGISSETGSRLP